MELHKSSAKKFIINTNLIYLFVIFSVSLLVSNQYFFNVHLRFFEDATILHNQIISGIADSPYRYRILVPLFTEFLSQFMSLNYAYYIYFSFATSVMFIVLYYFFRDFVSKEFALIGILFISGTIQIGLRDHYFQPWSLLEVALFTISLKLIFVNKFYSLVSIVILATLNRETGLFIPISFFLVNFNFSLTKANFKIVTKSFILLITWLIIYAILRIVMGNTPHIHTLSYFLETNLIFSRLIITVNNVILFFGVFWILLILGFKFLPLNLRRMYMFIPIFLLFYLVFTLWTEVRLLMTLYPIVITTGLIYIENLYKFEFNSKRDPIS